MINRRTFLRSALAAGGAAAVSPLKALASRHQTSSGYFGVHDFIESHYNSVFIMKTNVAAKTDSADIKAAALAFARSVFVPKSSGTPLTTIIPIKPNLTGNKGINYNTSLGDAYDSGLITDADVATYRMGTVTDAYFVEGILNGLLELGLSGNQMYIREVNGPTEFESKGYGGVVERTGINALKDLSAAVTALDSADVQWTSTPTGLWFRNIPHLWPVGAENTWMLNIPKFKAHYMGITTCCKNIQGTIAVPYQAHCYTTNAMKSNGATVDYINNRNSDYSTQITQYYNDHKAAGVSRWDLGYVSGMKVSTGYSTTTTGIGMETWAARCVDNNFSIKDTIGLHIVEGIYAREGDFDRGPSTVTVGGQSIAGAAKDYMTNVIIFGKNQVYVDMVAHYLAGHEPGNFGLFWHAKDRGLSEVVNPTKIPIYEWSATTGATAKTLSYFTRTSLKTPYMKKSTESTYHMCTEACTYPVEPALGVDTTAAPKAFVLHQNIPNPFNPSTSIEFYLPRGGNARLEIYNISGQLVDVLVDGYRTAGSHMAVWNTNRVASGTYFYRFRYGGFTETKKMTLLK